MNKIWRGAIGLAAAGLAVAAFLAPSATAENPAPGVAVHNMGALTTKWTPEAMRNAIPLDRLLPKVDASRVTHDVKQGTPQVVQPTAAPAAVEPMAFPHPGGPWSGGGAGENT